MDCSFANSTNWVIGFHANEPFLLSDRKTVFVIANLYFDRTPEYPAQMLTLFHLVARLEEFSMWPPCLETALWAQNQSLTPPALKKSGSMWTKLF